MLTAVFLQTHLLGSADAVQMLHRTIISIGSPSHQSQHIPPRSKTTKAVYWIRKEQAREYLGQVLHMHHGHRGCEKPLQIPSHCHHCSHIHLSRRNAASGRVPGRLLRSRAVSSPDPPRSSARPPAP